MTTRKFLKVFCLLFLIALQLTNPSGSYAQSSSKLESCFQYYNYGKVKAELVTERNDYNSGESARILGTVTNENSFPLRDVVLYAQLKRINNELSFNENGHYLIDRFTVKQELNFLPHEVKNIDVSFPINASYPNGEYEVHYFIYSPLGFHYGGRPFLEEDVAGISSFTITNGKNPDVFFDVGNVQVNSVSQKLRGATQEFTQDSLSFSIPVIDTRPYKSAVQVSVRWYQFEDTFEQNILKTEEAVYQPPDQTIQLTFSPPVPGAYVLVLEIDEPVRSMFKYRFAKIGAGSSILRMNDLGITAYPPTTDDRAFVCFHAPSSVSTIETTVKLAILDDKKNPVSSIEESQSFPPNVLALSLPLSKLKNKNDFWIQTTFIPKDTNIKQQKAEIHYTCDIFSDSVTALKLQYNATEKKQLTVQSIDLCGKSSTGYVEEIKIFKDNKTVLEKYNVTDGIVTVASLKPGTYKASAKNGKLAASLTFTIAEGNSFVMLIVTLGLAFMFFVGVAFIYRLRKSKPIV